MTTLAELVAAPPAATRGVLTSFVHGGGHWNFVVELADPAAGAAVQWFDITALTDPRVWTGYDLTRGGDSYLGRYRASVATLDLSTHDDSLAPWNGDTSATFGIHVELGPGLLIRAGFIRVDGGVVQQWNPRFTNKVEEWGDASHSQGKVRLHQVIARDTMSSLVAVPLPAYTAENWSDRMYHFLLDSGWVYGSAIYGAQFTSGGAPILALADRPASSSAITELDATLDPVGLTWYTNRLGQLVVRPRVDDTFHAAAFAAGATGDEYPGDVTPVSFAWYACQGDEGETPSDAAAYAVDFDPVAPFGFDKSEANVINHVVVNAPTGVFDDDDPISIRRYDRKTLQSSWQVENDTVAAQILETRRNAVLIARPLHTTAQLEGFFPGPANVDYLGYVAIDHRNNDEGLSAFGNGWVRGYREKVQPLGCDIEWSLTLTVDIFNIASAATIRPVFNLHLVGITDWAAEFGWNNPEQVVIPTHTQVRLYSGSSTPWMTVEYPGEVADAVLWTGLKPETRYEFQVRLIRVEDGQIVAFSPSRTYNVMTAEATGPDVDHGDDGDVVVTPGPLGPSCRLAVELQRLTPPSTWTTVASDTLEEGEQVSFDMNSLPSGTYRIQTQEVCDGIGGGWVIDPPFTNTCADPSRLNGAPYNDADLVAYIPQVCGTRIEEALSNQPVTIGNAYGGLDHDALGRPVLTSLNAGKIGYGVEPDPVAGTDDMTIACRIKLGALPTSETILWAYGGMSISIVKVALGGDPDATGFQVKGSVSRASGGTITINGVTVFGLDTEFDLALRHDVSAQTLRLYIDGAQDASELGTVGSRTDPFGYSIALPANSWITDMAVWERVLDPSELPGWNDPLLMEGWWGLAFSNKTTYSVELVGDGTAKLAGASGYGSVGGGACVVKMPTGTYNVSIGESGDYVCVPSFLADQVESWGFGGFGGIAGNGTTNPWSHFHGGGRTELRTSPSRANAVLIAPGGGGGTNAGGGGIGGFPDGSPSSDSGSGGFGGRQAQGAFASAPGLGAHGYASYDSGWTGDGGTERDGGAPAPPGAALGAGGRGGDGVYSFGGGGAGGGGGGGKHGGGGGSGGNGSSTNGGGGGGGSGDTGGASSVVRTANGVSKGLGLAAMRAKQHYSDEVVAFLNSQSPQTYIPGQEASLTGCIVVSDLVSGKAFWDREAATIFDGVAASPVQMFQGRFMNARGCMHGSRIALQRSPDFQMPAADAVGLFWNPPAFNAGSSWAIEWTQETITGDAHGPGTHAFTTLGQYPNADSQQMPWKVAASATVLSMTVQATSINDPKTASFTFFSRPTTSVTRYGISYNAATDTFHFHRSDGVTGTKTRTAAGVPTSGVWNAASYRPIMFSGTTGNWESKMQDVALFNSHRSQAQFMTGATTLGLPAVTAPVYKATGPTNTAAATDRITLALPAGWAPGDYAVAAVGVLDNVSAVNYAAAGWTVIGPTTAASSVRTNLIARTLQAGDTDPTFVFGSGGGSNFHVGVIVSYTAVGGAHNASEYVSTTPISGTEFTPTGFTTSINRSIVVSLGAVDFYQPLGLKPGAEQGFIVRATINVSGQGGIVYCDKMFTPAGPVTFPTYRGAVSAAQFGLHRGVELAGA